VIARFIIEQKVEREDAAEVDKEEYQLLFELLLVI
jgi:hypothetical protein